MPIARIGTPGVLAVALTAGLLNAGGSEGPSYRLRLRVEPDRHRIEASAVILHPPDGPVYLNERLVVTRFTSDGRDLAPSPVAGDDRLPYTERGKSAGFSVAGAGRIEIEYNGTLPGMENGVNCVGPELVELAHYACWFPKFRASDPFTWELEIDLPDSFTVTAGGRSAGSTVSGGRRRTRWVSSGPTGDIAFLASPSFRRIAGRTGGSEVEILFVRPDPRDMEGQIEILSRALRELSDRYGDPATEGFLRLAVSPRNGWGYSRPPLFVMPEDYVLSLLSTETGRADLFRGNTHELSHFWWMLAGTEGPDDWINEGLAEYTAFRLTVDRFGASTEERFLAEYRSHAAGADPALSIAETPSHSESRYANRYEKTTLILREAERRFGRKSLDRLLRSLHLRFRERRNSDTAAFLEEAGRTMGYEARKYFAGCLYHRGWPIPDVPEAGD